MNQANPLCKRSVILTGDLGLSLLYAAKQGATDPREIKKLIKRGVKVFTRSTLHAKVVLIDDVVFTGSANVSNNARNVLDEAIVSSSEPSAVRAAKKFIDEKCSEPVREGYLKECLAAYKPPVFKGAKTFRKGNKSNRGNAQSKLWYIGGLVYINVEKDMDYIEPLEKDAQQELENPETCEVSWIRFGHQAKWYQSIQRNSWIIDCTRVNKRVKEVGSPARVIRKCQYRNKSGKTYYMLMLERPKKRECMSLTEFQRRWRRVAPIGNNNPPVHSQAIQDEFLADSVLRFWTSSGRISRLRT